MPHERKCRACGDWHDLDQPWPSQCIVQTTTRSDLTAPMIISDTMDAVQSQLDGRMYDSKSALRSTYRQAGMVEVGNDKPKPFKKPKPDRQEIKAAVGKAFSQVGFGA